MGRTGRDRGPGGGTRTAAPPGIRRRRARPAPTGTAGSPCACRPATRQRTVGPIVTERPALADRSGRGGRPRRRHRRGRRRVDRRHRLHGAAEAGARVVRGTDEGGKGQAMRTGTPGHRHRAPRVPRCRRRELRAPLRDRPPRPAAVRADSQAPEAVLVKGFYERPAARRPRGRGPRDRARGPARHRPAVPAPVGGPPAAGRGDGRSCARCSTRCGLAPGYGVELALLIDVAEQFGVERVAQVDLGVRVHRNRPLAELRVQATDVLGVALRRAGVATAGRAGAGPCALERGRHPVSTATTVADDAGVGGVRRRHGSDTWRAAGAAAPRGDAVSTRPSPRRRTPARWARARGAGGRHRRARGGGAGATPRAPPGRPRPRPPRWPGAGPTRRPRRWRSHRGRRTPHRGRRSRARRPARGRRCWTPTPRPPGRAGPRTARPRPAARRTGPCPRPRPRTAATTPAVGHRRRGHRGPARPGPVACSTSPAAQHGTPPEALGQRGRERRHAASACRSTARRGARRRAASSAARPAGTATGRRSTRTCRSS